MIIDFYLRLHGELFILYKNVYIAEYLATVNRSNVFLTEIMLWRGTANNVYNELHISYGIRFLK